MEGMEDRRTECEKLTLSGIEPEPPSLRADVLPSTPQGQRPPLAEEQSLIRVSQLIRKKKETFL